MNGRDDTNAFLPLDFRIGGQNRDSYPTVGQYLTRDWTRYKCDSSMGVHRYTRWTGSLSHQISNLSHPYNLLLEGCDLCFA